MSNPGSSSRSRFGSPLGSPKLLGWLESLTYPYSAIMPAMVTNTTSTGNQLTKMTSDIALFSMTIQDEDLQIASSMSTLEALNIIKSSQGHESSNIQPQANSNGNPLC